MLELNSTAGSGRPGPKESEISLQKAFRIRPALRIVRMEEGAAPAENRLYLSMIYSNSISSRMGIPSMPMSGIRGFSALDFASAFLCKAAS